MKNLKTKMENTKTTILITAIIFLGVLFLTGSGFASTYYVAKNGNDSNLGSETFPWLTINHAISVLKGSDHLFVKAGTYKELPNISNLTGTANSPTIIQAYPGDTVILQSSGTYSGRVYIISCHYLVFDGFEVTNVNEGIYVQGQSTYVTIQNCKVHNVGQEAIQIFEQSHHINVLNNTLYDLGKQNANWGEGVYVGMGSGAPGDFTHDVLVQGNVIHDNGSEACDIKANTYNVTIDGNIIYKSNSVGEPGSINIHQMCYGAICPPQEPKHVVKNNIVYNVLSESAIYIGTSATVYNNIVYGSVPSCGIYVDSTDAYSRKIYHNTIDLSSSVAVCVSGSPNLDVRNNIGPTSYTKNIATKAAHFVNAAGRDYHLVSGSAPINAGDNLTSIVPTDKDGISRPQGSAPDIGAYEYASDTPPSDTTPPSPPTGLRVN